ncbi:hypothetical protein RZS08_31055, partial [Arthrospira platensis SPKY1]|nr:hypothetical protein [Arthrospira platensis SPKY1]
MQGEAGEHARRMQEMLCPLAEISASMGANPVGLSLEEYLEMLIAAGCKQYPGQRVPNHNPEAVLTRYGLKQGWMSSEGLRAFKF